MIREYRVSASSFQLLKNAKTVNFEKEEPVERSLSSNFNGISRFYLEKKEEKRVFSCH